MTINMGFHRKFRSLSTLTFFAKTRISVLLLGGVALGMGACGFQEAIPLQNDPSTPTPRVEVGPDASFSDTLEQDDTRALDDNGCAPGFSGSDCSFCTWETAGKACHPGSPRDLIDLEAIKALTLEELKWTITETQHQDGVTVVVGDWSGGIFEAYDPAGNPVDKELRERAAIYIPDGYPETPHSSLGFVAATHHSNDVLSGTGASMARYFGIPVLFHGEYNNWRDIGYPSREEINKATGVHLRRENLCEPSDFVRGNFKYALARTDMRAITLLQRLAEEHGGQVDKVALRGFSKEGSAMWRAALVDDRIEVGVPGGSQKQDPDSATEFVLATFGCEGDNEWSEKAKAAAEGRHWSNHTPAGAYSRNRSLMENKDLFYPRFFLIDGDVGMWNMHDGANGMPTGVESSFLDALVERPWRYIRKAREDRSWLDGDVAHTVPQTAKHQVPLLAAEILVEGPGSEEWLYPNILAESAEINGNQMVVTAQATDNTEFARVWWTWSADRIFLEPTQAKWEPVEMAFDGESWVSPTFDVPPNTVIAWYAEVGNMLRIDRAEHPRIHSAPIRLERQTEALSCTLPPTLFCE